MGTGRAAGAAVSGEDVALVAQVEEGPVIAVAAQIDVAAAASVAAVGAAFWDVLGAVHMHGAASTFSGAAYYLDVVDEIGVHSIFWFFKLSIS